jgi:hypothetical protein
MSWSPGVMASAISAIIAVAGTILGAALAYLFQNRASERAEASALQRELRAERMTVYSSYVTALTEFRRGQTDWYNRRVEDPDSGVTLAARIESYRLKGAARAVLSQVRLITSNPDTVAAAMSAFELTRPIHYAEDGADLRSRTKAAEGAVDAFIALAAREVQLTPVTDRDRQVSTRDRPSLDA